MISGLFDLLAQVAIAIACMLAITISACVGRRRLRTTRREWRGRVARAAPIALVLIAVLLVNRTVRDGLQGLSWDIGFQVTKYFREIEGTAILWFQSFASTELTMYFSFVYIYGYAFMLIFPVIAYFALSDTRPLRELLTAYTLNYSLGLVLYVLVVAYGPRNTELLPQIDTFLYTFRPQYQYLTGEVNRSVNVFPSLHTSLSATIAIFAYRTRDEYPKWFALAVPLAVSVAASTMYLGIHWAIDVLAGFALAAVAAFASKRLVGRWSVTKELDRRFDSDVTTRIRTATETLTDGGVDGDGEGKRRADDERRDADERSEPTGDAVLDAESTSNSTEPEGRKREA
ncbi:phosphatase PAP2 family protein [Natrialbaceae archaeon GCM10025810]|uniref:phosphatase PAP2 family protein n=1 Tax=Halovalidus salilacus TaxID=3075124 RepID=UPI00360F4FF8